MDQHAAQHSAERGTSFAEGSALNGSMLDGRFPAGQAQADVNGHAHTSSTDQGRDCGATLRRRVSHVTSMQSAWSYLRCGRVHGHFVAEPEAAPQR